MSFFQEHGGIVWACSCFWFGIRSQRNQMSRFVLWPDMTDLCQTRQSSNNILRLHYNLLVELSIAASRSSLRQLLLKLVGGGGGIYDPPQPTEGGWRFQRHARVNMQLTGGGIFCSFLHVFSAISQSYEWVIGKLLITSKPSSCHIRQKENSLSTICRP